jgi:hypothetical protein
MLLINANLDYFYGDAHNGYSPGVGFDLKLFTGDYEDFSEGWYYKVLP